MKNLLLFGPLVVLVLCITGPSVLAQSYVIENDLASASADLATSIPLVDTNVRYTGIGLSAPWMYAGETFKISLNVQNLGEEEIIHQVQLYRLIDLGSGKRALQTEMAVMLAPGATENIELSLTPEELVASGDPLEEIFVFFLGRYEIGLECEW